MLAQLGRDHRKYGVRAADYDVFGRALITALERYSEDVWVPELEEAWVRAYAYIAKTMIDGANEAAADGTRLVAGRDRRLTSGAPRTSR